MSKLVSLRRGTSGLLFSVFLVLVSCSGSSPSEPPPQNDVIPTTIDVHPTAAAAGDHPDQERESSIPAGKFFKVSGTVESIEKPNRAVMIKVVSKDRNGNEVIQDSRAGWWHEGTLPGEWSYQEELTAPRTPGTYTVIVKHGAEVIDEKTIVVAK